MFPMPKQPTALARPNAPNRRSRESGNPGQGRFPSPFALSLSKPVLKALEGGPPPPVSPRRPALPHARHSCAGRNPEGLGRGTLTYRQNTLPRLPKHPVAGALSLSPFALSKVEGAPSPQAHPDTSPWRPGQRPRYPSPMQHACNDLNQDIASTSPPWRSSPAPRVSTIASASAPDSRRLFRTGAKVAQRSFVAGTNTPATKKPRAATPARETTSWRSRRPAPAAPASNQDPRRQQTREMVKGGVPERC